MMTYTGAQLTDTNTGPGEKFTAHLEIRGESGVAGQEIVISLEDPPLNLPIKGNLPVSVESDDGAGNSRLTVVLLPDRKSLKVTTESAFTSGAATDVTFFFGGE